MYGPRQVQVQCQYQTSASASVHTRYVYTVRISAQRTARGGVAMIMMISALQRTHGGNAALALAAHGGAAKELEIGNRKSERQNASGLN